MSEITAYFRFKDEKVHSIRYDEVDVDGAPVHGDATKIGGLYLRKTIFPGGRYPRTVEATVRYDDY
ncbi:hypothetical protein LCGC14_2659270 [marine sediment metagenome]|uniref:Uncharacterized protein n=1 Tax=marine sediment metagenome TaxID=412755 RepID=A0A0F8ZSD6_9ZZZZ